MGIGDFVAWIQLGMWVLAVFLFVGRVVIKRAHWEGVMPKGLQALLSSNWLIGALIVIGLALSVYWRYQGPGYQHLSASEMEQVNHRQFVNESVELDGKNFVDCSFYGVKLIFHAKKEFRIADSSFYSPVVIHTDSPQAASMNSFVINLLRDVGFVNKVEVGFANNELVLQKLQQPPATNQQPKP